jgi:hypothetical protein
VRALERRAGGEGSTQWRGRRRRMLWESEFERVT